MRSIPLKPADKMYLLLSLLLVLMVLVIEVVMANRSVESEPNSAFETVLAVEAEMLSMTAMVLPPPPPLTPLKPTAQSPLVEPLAVQKSAPKPSIDMAHKPATSVVDVSGENAAQGQALLRLAENGQGPDIEIAWPDSLQQREALFDVLRA